MTKSAVHYSALPGDQTGHTRPATKDEDAELLDEIESELHKSPMRHSNQHIDSEESENTALFLFHANFITMCVGVATICLLWIPIPILHFLGMEEFGLPRSFGELAAVAGVCFGGVVSGPFTSCHLVRLC